MSEHGDTYRVYLDGGVGQDLPEGSPEGRGPTEARDIPFCLGIVGAFSGAGSRATETDPHAAPRRPFRRVTPENVVTLAGLTPALTLSGDDTGLASGPHPDAEHLRFSSLEDFHPDQLLVRHPRLKALWEARATVQKGGTSGDAAGSGGDSAEAGSENDQGDGSRHNRSESPGSEAGLLDAVLGQTAGSPDGPIPSGSRGEELDEDLDAFVRRAVDPHRVREDPRQAANLGELDLRLARELRKILHEPAFLELESLWRSVVFLLSRIQVTTRLRVYLIDVSEAELMGDLLSSDDPAEWGFTHTVLDPVSEDGESLRWAALVGAFRFGSDPLHVPLLQRIGLLVESGQVPWISGADGAFLGCSDSLAARPDPRDWTSPVDPLWAELRGKPEAEWIHLVLPEFLLRSPYGPDGTPTKRFAFQEDPAFPDDLLWGNPAVLMGMALARRFADSGWGMNASGRHEVADLPLVPAPDGHPTCLQTRISQTAASGVRNRGLNPVLTPRGEPRVFLEGIRSISTSETALRAWWNA